MSREPRPHPPPTRTRGKRRNATDVGAYGASSDCNIFKNSNFCKELEGNHLSIPGSRPLPNDDNGTPAPFVIVLDKSFALSQQALRPYISRSLDVARRMYNYILTRSRRMVECAFGIPRNKWRIFHRAIDVSPDFCDAIGKTWCTLYSFVLQTNGVECQDTLYECPSAREY